MNTLATIKADFGPAAMIKAIADATGRNEKEDRLAEFAATDDGKTIINWAYNPFITFGITWRKEPPYLSTELTHHYNQLPIVYNLLTQLASRDLTGNAAKEAVQAAFDSLNPAAAKILWLCLNKDLKAGVAEAAIKSVAPNLIPTFAVMRAQTYEEKLVKAFPVAVEPKLDGNRVSFIARDGSGGYFTRTGKVIASMDSMVPAALSALKAWFGQVQSEGGPEAVTTFTGALTACNGIPNVMIDGEMMSDKGFDAVNGALNAKDDRTDGLSFHIFDMLSWEEFDAMGAVEVSYAIRRQRVNSFVVAASGLGMARIVRQTQIEICHSAEEIQEAYVRHRLAGQEGAMVKDITGFYEKKKSRIWLKLKNEDTEDLPIVGVFQGKPNGKYADTLGGFIVDREGVEVRVPGISEDVRAMVWDLWLQECLAMGLNPEVGFEGWSLGLNKRPEHPVLLGRLIEVEFHEVTKDGSLRHPRYVRFRDDKSGEIDK